MPEPNPLLGVHVTPGTVAWAQVFRNADGGFRVLDWGTERAGEDATAAVARGAEISARRTFRGRGAFIALPDGSGCLATASMQPEELDLAGDDLARELHEYTPFEPDVASLRYRLARTEGRRREFVVAAIPAAQERRFLDAASASDDGTLGYGFAGSSVVRGARSLGLVGASGFVVELLPRTTHVYAVDDVRVRRYLIAAGADDIVAGAAKALARDAADVRRQIDSGTADAATQAAFASAAEAVAEDVRGLAAYHVAQRFAPEDVPADHPPARFVAAGPLLARAPFRRALAAHLGPEFERIPDIAATIGLTWARAPGDEVLSVVGALGAALEAFEPTGSRLALRDPPREVAEFHEPRRWAWALGAVVVAAAAAGAWIATQTPEVPGPQRRTSTAEVRGPAEVVAPAPAPAAAPPTLHAEAHPDGVVRLTWAGIPSGTSWQLLRRDPGAATWTEVGRVGADLAPTELRDDPPGPAGTYHWRLVEIDGDAPDSDEVSLAREVTVACDFLGLDAAGRARFRLRRTWHGAEVSAEVAVAAGGTVEARREIAGASGVVVLAPGVVVRSVRTRDEDQIVRVQVAEFGSDGRVVRAADGSVRHVEREVVRPVRVHEADLTRPPDERPVTVSRKMTDG